MHLRMHSLFSLESDRETRTVYAAGRPGEEGGIKCKLSALQPFNCPSKHEGTVYTWSCSPMD